MVSVVAPSGVPGTVLVAAGAAAARCSRAEQRPASINMSAINRRSLRALRPKGAKNTNQRQRKAPRRAQRCRTRVTASRRTRRTACAVALHGKCHRRGRRHLNRGRRAAQVRRRRRAANQLNLVVVNRLVRSPHKPPFRTHLSQWSARSKAWKARER